MISPRMLLPAVAALASLALFGGQVQADGIASSIKIRGGTLACGGNHYSRLSGSEQHRTAYVFRNFSRSATVTIERLRIFDAHGDVLFSYPEIALPPSVRTELGPHQTTQIFSGDILFADLDSNARPIQLHVIWSFAPDQKDIALDGSVVRLVRVTSTGAELSRSSSECRLIEWQR